MSISPRSRARRLQRLLCLKYYDVLKWGNSFTSGMNSDGRLIAINRLFKIFTLIDYLQKMIDYFWKKIIIEISKNCSNKNC